MTSSGIGTSGFIFSTWLTSAAGDLVDNGHIVARDDRRGVFLHLAVALHHVGLQLLGRRRRPNDGVGAGGDGLTDALGRLAARCDERQVGIVLAQLAQDLGRVLAGRDVEDLGSGTHFGVSIVVATYDRGDDGYVGDVGDVLDHFGGGGGVDHAAAAPCISETAAICTERLPVVVPPPTPTKTGHSATVNSACVMAGCGVKG